MINDCGFVQPGSLIEALDLLAADETLPLAGGTNVLVNMKRAPLETGQVLDLTKLEELKTIDENDDGTLSVVSSLAIYQNMLDGINSHIDAGESRLFVVGRYIDTMKIEGDKAVFLSRKVALETRRLDKGSHWPL